MRQQPSTRAHTAANLVAVGCLLLLIAVETALCLAFILSH